jgi:hypothetical protein
LTGRRSEPLLAEIGAPVTGIIAQTGETESSD